MSEIIDQLYAPLLAEHGLSVTRITSNTGHWVSAGNFLPKSEKVPTGLMDRKTYTILKFTIFLSTRISCWNVLCQNV